MAKEIREVVTKAGQAFLVYRKDEKHPWRIYTTVDAERDKQLSRGITVAVGLVGTVGAMFLKSRGKSLF